MHITWSSYSGSPWRNRLVHSRNIFGGMSLQPIGNNIGEYPRLHTELTCSFAREDHNSTYFSVSSRYSPTLQEKSTICNRICTKDNKYLECIPLATCCEMLTSNNESFTFERDPEIPPQHDYTRPSNDKTRYEAEESSLKYSATNIGLSSADRNSA